MACSVQCAQDYVSDARIHLIEQLKNLPLIIEKLYQKKVLNNTEVSDLEAIPEKCRKTRKVLDWITNKGKDACLEFLKILDLERKSVLPLKLHTWISHFSFGEESDDRQGPTSCHEVQTLLKTKAKQILDQQWKRSNHFFGGNAKQKFTYIPLVLDIDKEKNKPHNKVIHKSKKSKKPRGKKLRSYIPKDTCRNSPEDLLNSQEKSILLVGKPGIGKTTAVKQMLYLWAERHDENLDFMFYFDKNMLTNIATSNLQNLLLDTLIMSNADLRLKAEEITQYLEDYSEKVTIIFDGISGFHDNSVLLRIIHHELLPEAKIVVTCRPETEDDDFFDWPTCKVYVQGFNEESIYTYLTQMPDQDPELVNSVVDNPALFSLCHVPMYAFMVAACFSYYTSEGAHKQCTATELYIRIFRHCIQRHVNKKLGQLDAHIKDCKDKILLLAESAFSATKLKTINLEFDYSDSCIAGVFLRSVSVVSPAFARTFCSFLHNTIQEFFSALWLLEKPQKLHEVLQLCQTEEYKHMKYVIPFLCGLLSETNIPLLKCLFPPDQLKGTFDGFSEKVLKSFLHDEPDEEYSVDAVFLCQCLNEFHSSEACFWFLERVDYSLDLSEEHLDPHQCCAVSYVISQSRDKPIHLNLENSVVSFSGLKTILRHSQNLSFTTKQNQRESCEEWEKRVTLFKLNLCLQAALHQKENVQTTIKKVTSCGTDEECNFLLDLYSCVKQYEIETGRNVLPALLPLYQSTPAEWIIDLSERKASLLLEVLKLQTEKKTVELSGWSDEESEVRSFLQCLPFISQLRFAGTKYIEFVVSLFHEAAESERQTGQKTLELLTSMCINSSFPHGDTDSYRQSAFLLDLYSHVKQYETETGRNVLPALLPVYQSAPAEWIIDLSERRTSLLLEVLKLQRVKKPVELRGWSDEESEIRRFFQCLPFISQLRFADTKDIEFVVNLFHKAAESERQIRLKTLELLMSVCSLPYGHGNSYIQSDFLLDLYSHVKQYETETGRNVLPALRPVYQSVPAEWIIDLSVRKASLLLEVLKLQTVKKPVELRGWLHEESEVRSFLQCLPFISQLRFNPRFVGEQHIKFMVNLFRQAAESERQTGEKTLELLTSACTYSSFPYGSTDSYRQSAFLLDLYSHVKQYETETGRNVLPALLLVYQSVPAEWIIDLSERRTSLLLEVLKLQTEKKPVKLRGWSDEESEVRSFLQCLSFISQLRFSVFSNNKKVTTFLMNLIHQAAENERQTGEKTLEMLSSVCTYSSFPHGDTNSYRQSAFLLDLYSHVKQYEIKKGRTVLPALLPVYQAVPAEWIIDLSERKASLLLEVLKLQTEKKPLELRGWSDKESEVRSFLQCLPFISQLRFSLHHNHEDVTRFLVNLFHEAAERETLTGEKTLEQLTSLCTYSSFTFGDTYSYRQSAFLLDLYSHVKEYETKKGRTVLPALLPVYQSAPVMWFLDLSEWKTSLLLEVLKLQMEKKPVELRGCSGKESEVRSFLQCLPFISQLRFSLYNNNEDIAAFLVNLFHEAAESERLTGEKTLELLTSLCTYSSFPYGYTNNYRQSDFLLDLYSHMKLCETGRNVLPALLPVYQSVPGEWIVNLSERKASLLLEVLKLQTVKKPVELWGWADEESEVRSFLQCLPFISHLRFSLHDNNTKVTKFVVILFYQAAESERQTGEKTLELLTSLCTHSSFPYTYTHSSIKSDFLLDLYSHVKQYETETGRNVLPALLPVYQSVPAEWIIDLSEGKASILLEVLKLQTVKKPVELRGWSHEESEVRTFLQCLPFISQLRFSLHDNNEDVTRFLVNMFHQAAETERQTGEKTLELLTSLCTYSSFPCGDTDSYRQSAFLLDLYSHVKQYETETGRNVLPALRPVYQSVPAEWIIDLSVRKASLLLEVLKLQTVKKPVELRGWLHEESEVRSFLQCLPFISQLRFNPRFVGEQHIKFMVNLFRQAAESERQTGEKTLELLTSACTYSSFPYGSTDSYRQSAFLLDLYSHVKQYETETGRNVLPALLLVYQSVPAEWIIDLSERRTSLLLEVLKLQTEKKPVKLRGWSDEESEVRSFLQCLSFISQLRFSVFSNNKKVTTFLMNLIHQAAENERQTGEKTLEMLSSVCTYSSFPHGDTNSYRQSAFLLDLYSHVKQYEIKKGRTVLPALLPVYQAVPAEWIIDLSERKASLLLEVLKLQTEKKPLELRGWSDKESEVRSFLQCLPFISQLRFSLHHNHEDVTRFLVNLFHEAAERETLTGEKTLEQLTSLCTYSSFTFGDTYSYRQSAFLLDLYSHVKEYETKKGRTVLPALLPVYQSAPVMWFLDLSEWKTSLLLEVLKLQMEKKPVELRGCLGKESEVRSFLQCLPFISQLRFSLYNNNEDIAAFLVNLFHEAAESERLTGEKTLELLTSLCTYSSFPYGYTNNYRQSDFLLDLYSHMKLCETGRNVLPALLPVYQSVPAEWIVNLSERKASLLLEVLKLQTVKKPVELWGWADEESEVRSFLQCLPFISQLRFSLHDNNTKVTKFVVILFYQAAESERQTGEKTLELLTSLCTHSSFPYTYTHSSIKSDFLLDLYSHVKQYETETGRNVLPALLPVYQSVPAEWIIDLSEGKASILLEVLKLQTVKKPVELRGWSHEESEVRTFLQCLPFISQLRFSLHDNNEDVTRFLVNMFHQAAETERQTGEKTLELLTSLCTYSSFPCGDTDSYRQSAFLLDLYSHVKQYETETGRNVLPALLPVYQSAPTEWIIDLSERRTSLLLEVLKHQTEKKPVELRGWSHEESEVRTFLQCLPFISQLRFSLHGNNKEVATFLVNLIHQVAESERQTGAKTLELLTSACTYSSFPRHTHCYMQSDFLLDLYSHVKQYKTETGRNVLPALLPVYKSAPVMWFLNLSERKASFLLEVLKLQTEKKPVELRGWSDEESEVRTFLQCLPFISHLRYAESLVPYLNELVVKYTRETELLTALLSAMDSTFTVNGVLSSKKCRAVGRALGLSPSRLNLTLKPRAISLRGAALLFRHITHLHKLCLNDHVVGRMARAFRAERVRVPLVIEELSVVLTRVWSDQKLSWILSSLSSLLNIWTVRCLILTECEMEALSLIGLMCHPGPLTIRLSKETLQQFAVLVYEVKDRMLTCFFLEKVEGDLTFCSLSWEELIYFVQHGVYVTVNVMKSSISYTHARELLPLLDKVHFKRLRSSVVLSIIREVCETGSAHCVSSLLSSIKNCINLNSRELDSFHCAALRFTLQHCTTVSLSLLWTSIPEGELKSILPLLSRVSHLSVDRFLLLKLLHCCSVSQLQERAAAAAVLSALQNRLDFSCRACLDLTTQTEDTTLHLTTEDCRVISTVILKAQKHTELILEDCEIEDAGVDVLFSALHTVRLRCSKALLLQFLALIQVGPEQMFRAVALSRALDGEVDLSEAHLDLQACKSLAFFLEYTDDLSELDLSHCRLTNHCLELLLPYLHKVIVLDLSHNDISDSLARRIFSIVSSSCNIQIVRLFNIRITDKEPFLKDKRFEIW
ncbi:hypothetical protein MHYP_G00306620 [Metynnis hypsauchen]